MVEESRTPEPGPTPPPLAEAPRAEERDGQPPGGLLHPTVRYEHSDANFRWIFGILVGALVFAVVIQFAIQRLFFTFRDHEAAIKRSQYPMATAGSESLPPKPRLEQIDRMAGIEKSNIYLRQEQMATILRDYGAAEAGYVRIPIDRAIELLAEMLSTRAKRPMAEQARRQNGLVGGGESNSGRLFRGAFHD